MEDNITQTNIECDQCGTPLIRVEHYEYDGINECGSYEPWLECPQGCEEESIIL